MSVSLWLWQDKISGTGLNKKKNPNRLVTIGWWLVWTQNLHLQRLLATFGVQNLVLWMKVLGDPPLDPNLTLCTSYFGKHILPCHLTQIWSEPRQPHIAGTLKLSACLPDANGCVSHLMKPPLHTKLVKKKNNMSVYQIMCNPGEIGFIFAHLHIILKTTLQINKQFYFSKDFILPHFKHHGS